MIARIYRAAIDAVVLALHFALVAIGHATGEALLFQVLQASRVIGELAVEVHDRVSKMRRNGLSAVHCPPPQIVCHFFYVMSRDNYHIKIRETKHLAHGWWLVDFRDIVNVN